MRVGRSSTTYCILSLVFLGALVVLAPPAAADDAEFVRGDVNQDGKISITDSLFLKRYLYSGGLEPRCLDAADLFDDGKVTILDEILSLVILFDPAGCLTVNSERLCNYVLPEPYPLPGLDPTADDLPCSEYEVVPGQPTDDIIRVGSVTAVPGSEVSVPIFVKNSVPLQAFQLVIEVDPSLFEVVTDFGGNGHSVAPDFSGTEIEAIMNEYDPHAEGQPGITAVTALEGTGCVAIGGLLHLFYEIEFPVHQEEVVLCYLVGTVPEGVPDGTVIQLYPTNGENGEGTGTYEMMNELSYHGETNYASILPQQLEHGEIHVKSSPDTMDFIRGDVNHDGKFNVADPIFLLQYLFANGSEPACADAADMNDDGTMDMADAIAGLTYLFRQSDVSAGTMTTLGRCGRDETADELDPCVYAHCP